MKDEIFQCTKLEPLDSSLCAMYTIQHDSNASFQFVGTKGTILMSIKMSDGSVDVANLNPATETAREVLECLVKWMPQWFRNPNNPALPGELVTHEDEKKVEDESSLV